MLKYVCTYVKVCMYLCILKDVLFSFLFVSFSIDSPLEFSYAEWVTALEYMIECYRNSLNNISDNWWDKV